MQNIVRKPEDADALRHVARIGPIRDDDLVEVAQQGDHEIAQENGVASGQRRDDEQTPTVGS